MKKHFHPLGDWRRNVLLLAAASSLGLALPACSSDDTVESRRDQAANGQGNGADEERPGNGNGNGREGRDRDRDRDRDDD